MPSSAEEEHLVHWVHGEHIRWDKWYFGDKWNMGIKKPVTLDRLNVFTNLLNYFLVVSAAGAIVESTFTESVLTAVESVVAGAVEAPPQATNDVAIATIAITFFIFVLFCVLNLIDITLLKYKVKGKIKGGGL